MGRSLVVAVSRPEGEQPRRRMPATARLATVAYGISGFTAMGYEVLWTRSLEHYTHNSTYAYTTMLATFLLGLGLGSAALARFADRVRRPVFTLGVLQLGIGLSVLLALVSYMQFEDWVPRFAAASGGISSWVRVMFLIFGEAAITMFASTLFLGAMFPVVARIVVDELSIVGRRVGTAYVANTVGSILGSLLVGFFVLPWLGVRGAFVALIVVNLSLSVVLALFESRRRSSWALVGGAALVCVATLALLPQRLFEEQFVARYGELPFYREEVTDTVMVTEDADGERVIRYSDGRGTAGTRTYVEDRMYAHIPMLLHAGARKVLQIGFGVGNTLSSVLQHPVESAICVELSPGVIDAAPFFQKSNRDVLEDSRVTLVVNDGRNFLLTTRREFDVIRMDPPELHTAGVVNLYTREFFELARDHLADGGIFSVWINNVMTPEPDIQMLLRTVGSVFPHVSVWHGPAMYSWVINGSMESHAPDLARIEGHLADPKVAADLATIGITDAFEFLAHFVMGGDELAAYAGEGPLVVDDHTRLDFTVPRSENAFFGFANFNTSYWLVEFMDDRSIDDEQGAQFLFLRIVKERTSRKQPVLPQLENARAAGYDDAEVERRLEEAYRGVKIR